MKHGGSARSAMPIYMAKRICPQAKIIKGDHELYSKLSQTVTQIIDERAPVMEKASIDEFYPADGQLENTFILLAPVQLDI